MRKRGKERKGKNIGKWGTKSESEKTKGKEVRVKEGNLKLRGYHGEGNEDKKRNIINWKGKRRYMNENKIKIFNNPKCHM